MATLSFLLISSGGGFAQGCSLEDITSSPTAASQKNFSKLVKCIEELQQRLEKIQSASGSIATRATNADTSPGGISGLSGTFDRNNEAVKCPPGSFVSAIQGFTSGGVIRELKYDCRSVR